jgi:hypothetical protein
MVRASLFLGLLSLTLVGCNDRFDDRPLPPARPTERTPPPPPANQDKNIRINTPGADVNVDIDRKNGKRNIDVDVKTKNEQ